MDQCFFEQDGAAGALQPIDDLALGPVELQLRVLLRQRFFIIKSLCRFRPQFRYHTLHLRDDIASLEDNHRITHSHVLARDFIGVVQGSVLHRGAGHVHRIEHGDRRGCTRPADVNDDILHDSRGLFGGIFVGDGAARVLADRAQLVVARPVVHFHHQAIGIERQVVPFGVPFVHESHDIVQLSEHRRLAVSSNTQLA